MTATEGKPPRRYSREQQQENRSRAQLVERLSEPEIGWIASTVETDMGEDLLVRIYDNGVSSGLSFYIQLKSAADAKRLKKKKTPEFAYKLDVKDLEHWEWSTTLVVLVLWDVQERTGWWRSIPEIITELDTISKTWRKQQTVTVNVPQANGTDKSGLTNMRHQVADYSAPVLPMSQETPLSLIFSKSEAGTAGLRALKHAVEMDEHLVLENDFAPKIRFSERHRRLYGLAPVIQAVKFEKGKASPSKKASVFRVEVSSSEGYAEYPYVEFRPVTQGSKRFVLTNSHQSLPLVFRLELDLQEESIRFGFKQRRSGHKVYEARGVATFVLVAAASGAMIRITDPSGEEIVPSFPAPTSVKKYDLQSMRRWRELLDKLWYIQQKAGGGTFQLKSGRGFSSDEVSLIDSLFEIYSSGRKETTMSILFEIPPMFEGRGPLNMVHHDRSVSFLGLKIPLGDMRVTVLDQDRVAAAIHKARLEANASGKPAVVELDELPILQEYVSRLSGNLPWPDMHEALDRLAEAAGSSDGYFARADARVAGATDAIFDALLGEKKVEQIVPGVFRLSHFVRSEHEELISLWLQTDRKGILSHDTALVLNELSDILPRRRHISVPPGWSPGDRQLDADVVLHHADVSEDEIRWLGPIPYTAPLRTVRDCIASHLSPDLIEQAIADGLRRGMFTESDLPPDARRGAA